MVWNWLLGRKTHKPSPLDGYLGLRNLVLNLDASVVGAAGEREVDAVWGIMMEFCVRDAQVTLAGMADGTTSLYFSNGGGVIGAGGKPEVAEQTRQWLQLARRYVPQSSATTEFPVATAGLVQFYLFVPRGKCVIRADERALSSGGHWASLLFAKGHEVLAAVRVHSQSAS